MPVLGWGSTVIELNCRLGFRWSLGDWVSPRVPGHAFGCQVMPLKAKGKIRPKSEKSTWLQDLYFWRIGNNQAESLHCSRIYLLGGSVLAAGIIRPKA